MRTAARVVVLPLAVALLASATAAAVSTRAAFTPGEDRPGGAATSLKPRNANAFSQPSANLAQAQVLDFRVGDGIFRKQWASSPASTKSSDGLGPLFNARACQNCHLKDGRGQPPMAGEQPSSLLLKLAIAPRDDSERQALADHRVASIADPTYGQQLQTFAIQGFDAEATVTIAHEPIAVTLAGGESVTLERPRYHLDDLAYGPLHAGAVTSPRVAPPMIGMGLLELIPEPEILARADPEDLNGDGISGIAQTAWSEARQQAMLGRFGWKATQPTVEDQIAAAFSTDMGLSTPIRTAAAGDCTAAQAACRAAPNGADAKTGVEVTPPMFDLVTLYSRNLAVPARIDARKPEVLRGKQLFAEIGCAACHTPRHVTGVDPDQPHLSRQEIWPYTDLLLHDMGPDLADDLAEGKASGRHWRTPPLWGLGLTRIVSGHTRLLHDGRARNALEAVLWHGGEGLAARDRFRDLPRQDRAALLAFLESL